MLKGPQVIPKNIIFVSFVLDSDFSTIGYHRLGFILCHDEDDKSCFSSHSSNIQPPLCLLIFVIWVSPKLFYAKIVTSSRTIWYCSALIHFEVKIHFCCSAVIGKVQERWREGEEMMTRWWRRLQNHLLVARKVHKSPSFRRTLEIGLIDQGQWRQPWLWIMSHPVLPGNVTSTKLREKECSPLAPCWNSSFPHSLCFEEQFEY